MFKGQVLNNGKVDIRETVTNVCVSFLTTETIVIDGVSKPRYVGFWASWKKGTVEYPSKLRDFVKGWFPKLTDEKIDDPAYDFEKLIGQGAYVTVIHKPRKDGSIKAEVKGAMTPPPGMPIPAIPADFVRHKDRAENEQAAKGAQSIRDEQPF